MGRPRQHGPETRLALLDAAEELVAAGGMEAVSVRAVADRVGTSVRAVYSVFGSKDGLVRGLAVRGFELLMEQVDSVPSTDDPGQDLAGAATQGFRSFALGHPQLFSLIFLPGANDLGGEAGVASSVAFSRLAARLERARDMGLVPDRPVGELGMEFHALCQGLATIELCGVVAGAAAKRMWADATADLLAGWQAAASASAPHVGLRGKTARSARSQRQRATRRDASA